LESRLEAVLRVFGTARRREVHRRVDGVEPGRDRSDALRALGIHGILLMSASALVNGSLPPRARRTGTLESMTTARTREYPQQPRRRPQRRRRTLIRSAIVILGTLIIGVVAADRIVDYTSEQRIAESLEDYAEADVSVEGFPVLTQLAGGELDSVAITP